MRGKFVLRDDSVYKMPVHFGGDPFTPVRTVYGDMTGITVMFETDPEALLSILPEDFELLAPMVNVQFANAREVDWMTGGEYRLIQASSPVRYVGNAEGLEGEYVFVIWENKACPILGGREEDGMPKVYADIASERHYGDEWFTAASYESHTFLSLEFSRKEELGETEIGQLNARSKVNYFGWRYLPNLGKGGASLSHATLYPQEMTVKKGWKGEGRLLWTPPDWWKHPLQARIISTLASLPVRKMAGGAMFKGVARLNVGDSRRLP
ncbi:acetoacetate decarboxylase [Aminivibrio pyruvatiphilus]|jgi:acetoacetate decarboxylase|uniref:Acetoacetate decarboxylase n=1 Tax=Aminivibrio pyruvatiphilus TaxID=1005740 RepID=A0A4R8M175_9BACT|nr:acetoacetate decarboxylase family protein [Aminivibrio pyruvatiphilus]TDY55355.1 acetoacetate decarboxylase [Aminivibrio pyruvatiphilus]